MPKISQPPLPETVPVKYGNSMPKALVYRSLYVLGFWQLNEKQFIKDKKTWERANRDYLSENGSPDKKILEKRIIENPNTVIQLVHRNIFLRNVIKIENSQNNTTLNERKLNDILYIETKEKSIPSKQQVKVSDYEVTWINCKTLPKEMVKDFFLSISISLLKVLLDSSNPKNTELLFFCALITGLVKGIVKFSCDILVKEDISLKILPEKCSIEILAEITSEFLLLACPYLGLYAGISSGIKGVLKYCFKHLIKQIWVLTTAREAILEFIKLGSKATSRIFFAQLIAGTGGFPFGIFGSIFGSLVATAWYEIFFSQAFY